MALKAYTRDGPYGYLLDTTGAEQHERSRVEVYEMRPLMDLDDSVKLPVLLHLLREVERGLDGSPTLILLDEAESPDVLGSIQERRLSRDRLRLPR